VIQGHLAVNGRKTAPKAPKTVAEAMATKKRPKSRLFAYRGNSDDPKADFLLIVEIPTTKNTTFCSFLGLERPKRALFTHSQNWNDRKHDFSATAKTAVASQSSGRSC
jgi:hypothetical protein